MRDTEPARPSISLLAKVIVHVPAARWGDGGAKAARTLREFRIGGVETNIAFLQAVLAHPDFIANRISTSFIDSHVAALVGAAKTTRASAVAFAGDAAERCACRSPRAATGPAGSEPVPAPLQGTVVAIEVSEGDLVRPGQQIAVIESMKMEHLVTAPHGGIITKIAAGDGVTLMQGEPILFIEPAEVDGARRRRKTTVDLDHIRPDLAELIARHALTLDENRPACGRAPAQDQSAHGTREHRATRRSRLVRRIRLAGDRRAAPPAQARRPDQEHAGRWPDRRGRHRQRRQVRRGGARCMVIAYDYTVLAGTQGHMNHKKIDRMLGLPSSGACRWCSTRKAAAGAPATPTGSA